MREVYVDIYNILHIHLKHWIQNIENGMKGMRVNIEKPTARIPFPWERTVALSKTRVFVMLFCIFIHPTFVQMFHKVFVHTFKWNGKKLQNCCSIYVRSIAQDRQLKPCILKKYKCTSATIILRICRFSLFLFLAFCVFSSENAK